MVTLRLTPEFKEFLNLVNSAKIEYLLIGGYAVGLYGYIRPTKDIDLWVAVDDRNLEKLLDVLERFGFKRSSLPNPLFAPDKTVLRMGLPPDRIEIISQISGVDFRDCFARRRQMVIDGISVNVIDYEDLKKNKRATGRTRDAGDIEQLEKRQAQP
jgi:hypothetical protein